jgi:hypothetical protein
LSLERNYSEFMKTMYRLPDGSITFNYRRYSSAWKRISQPIEKATNSRLIGFNPGLSLVTKEKPPYFWELDWYAACLLAKALSEKT